MTTLAYDGRYIAADGRCTVGNMITGKRAQKLYLIKGIVRGVEDEILLAGAGSFEQLTIIKNWLEQGGDFFGTDPESLVPEVKPESSEGFFALKSGGFYTWETGLVPMEQEAPAMGGSGGAFAFAGMVGGMNAVEAVYLAIEIDIASGGQVTCFDTEAWDWVDPAVLITAE